MTIDQHLDNVFNDAAQRFEQSVKGTLYNYRFYSRDIMRPELIASGRGYIMSCRYNRSLDCDIYVVLDSDTGERHVGNQFRFSLEKAGDGY